MIPSRRRRAPLRGALLMVALTLAAPALLPAQEGKPAAPASRHPLDELAARITEPDPTVTYETEATVYGSYDNELFLLGDGNSNFMLMTLPESLWGEGLKAGDRAVVAGKLERPPAGMNQLYATRVSRTGHTPLGGSETHLITVRDALAKPVGSAVAIGGAIKSFSPTTASVADPSGSIEVATDRTHGLFEYHRGRNVVVLGVMRRASTGEPRLEFIAGFPQERFRRKGEPETAQAIHDVLRTNPEGTMVRAKGVLGLYLGTIEGEQGKALYLREGGEDRTAPPEQRVLIVFPAPRYQAYMPRTGVNAHVIGTYHRETLNDTSFGVLRDARIEPQVE